MLGAAAKELEELVLERFQDEMPNIQTLKATLERIELSMAQQAPSPSAPQPGASEAHGQAVQSSPRAATVELAAPTAQLADPAQVNKFLKEVGDSLHKASRALFKVSKEDPLSYRLCRQGLYMPFAQAPAPENGNQTMVPPPPPDREPHLSTLLSSQNWAMLLDEAESGLASARLWLDQHRYVALALAGLGHEKAREIVVAETVSLVQRLPGVLEREFSDGQPFASRATKEWLKTASPGTSGSAAVGASRWRRVRRFRTGAYRSSPAGHRGEARRGREEAHRNCRIGSGRREGPVPRKARDGRRLCGFRGSCPCRGDFGRIGLAN